MGSGQIGLWLGLADPYALGKGHTVTLDEVEDELFRLRIRKAMGQLEKPVALRDARKNLARVKTVLREKAK